MPNDGSDQRQAPRHFALVAAHIDTDAEDADAIAMARNISVTGALLLTRILPDVGETLELQLVLSAEPGAERVALSATVVRAEERPPDGIGLWPYLVAVQFDEPVPHLEEELIKLEAPQPD